VFHETSLKIKLCYFRCAYYHGYINQTSNCRILHLAAAQCNMQASYGAIIFKSIWFKHADCFVGYLVFTMRATMAKSIKAASLSLWVRRWRSLYKPCDTSDNGARENDRERRSTNVLTAFHRHHCRYIISSRNVSADAASKGKAEYD